MIAKILYIGAIFNDLGMGNNYKKGLMLSALLLSLLIFLSNSAIVQAFEGKPDIVLSNSQDWRDVYSVMLYASLIGAEGRFITSTRHGSIILYSIPKDAKILIVSSKKNPFVTGYKVIFEGNQYKYVDEILVRNANLELAKKLEDIHSFIVVDDSYGYHAIAAAPYAALTHSYVLLVDDANIRSIKRFLKERGVDKLIIFGHLSRDIRNELQEFNPEIIDKGDRFEDDIAIVKKYLEINPRKQVLMSSGEFIEASFFTGKDPLLFIGKGVVPPQIRDFIKQSDFIAAVLVGNELINTATFIRRQIGISVFVKFAQSARIPAGTISKVEDLDRFWMPTFNLNLTITRIVYNRATRSLDVTYYNPSPVALYFKSTITINTDQGQQIVVGDEQPIFLGHKVYKTIPYVLDEPLSGEEATASVYAIYGEGKKSMENLLEKQYTIHFVDINDESLLNITDVSYDVKNKRFVVKLKNEGKTKVYADVEIEDVWVDGNYVSVSAGEIVTLSPGQSKKVYIPLELSEEDISMNDYIRVKAFYGQNKEALIKVAYAEIPFNTFSPLPVKQGAVVVIIVVIVLLIIFSTKKCPNCGARNVKWAKRCRKCGEKL